MDDLVWCSAKTYGVVICLQLLHRQDKTAPGHVLGPADKRSKIPAPERDLSASATSILRTLVHMTLLLGSNTDPKVSYTSYLILCISHMHLLMYPNSVTACLIADWPVTFGLRQIEFPPVLISWLMKCVLLDIVRQMARKQKINTLLKTISM